jgi:hypothetical protein
MAIHVETVYIQYAVSRILYTVSSRVMSPFSFKTKITLNNETPKRFAQTTDNEFINNIFLNITIDQCKFVPKYSFNYLTNLIFHKSPNIVIATHMNYLHTIQKLHID